MDFFLYRRGLLSKMPEFVFGRTTIDNWIIYDVVTNGGFVIDTNPAVRPIHLDHDYSMCPGGAEEVAWGPEAKRNVELTGGRKCLFDVRNRTHILNADLTLTEIPPEERITRALLGAG